MLVILLSRSFAVYKRCPVTVFLIAGIFPLVPGSGIYWTAFYVVTNDLEQAGARGFLTFKDAVAIVLGNEAHGLSEDVVAACDAAVTITMDGPAESLNVAMAGTVLCFEALRRRRSD